MKSEKIYHPLEFHIHPYHQQLAENLKKIKIKIIVSTKKKQKKQLGINQVRETLMEI